MTAGRCCAHRSRQPGQCRSNAHRNALGRLEIHQSTSRTGSCLDGAAAESFFVTIKTEIGTRFWTDHASASRHRALDHRLQLAAAALLTRLPKPDRGPTSLEERMSTVA
jgi:transposase InsO family protein